MDDSEGSYGTDDRTRPGFLGREALDMGVLLLAAGAAHVLVLSLGHSDGGVRALITVGAILLAVSALHRWHRHRSAAVRRSRGGNGPKGGSSSPRTPEAGDRLWSVRVTLADVPGGLAELTARFAALGVDIRLMQVHPDGAETTDEFLVSAPAHVVEETLYAAVLGAGVREAIVRPADVHELSDTTSRTLRLVSAMVEGATTLEGALLSLASAQDVERADAAPEGMGEEDTSGTTMTLPSPDGAVLVVRRVGVPFTAVEFARCRALAQVAASLHGRSRQR
ncbi:ACT domain-containing protein [Nocardiopsis sp. EMB25]|uniref:ACT domain-containing protein n=1 Tax=Nocardiopsis TaxID=2013 RepID=UPI00034A7340|nr:MULTISPECIES: ACT domain-containing protein [Nocardiopsis]MCY9786747.1 ACT domain-containing protein [Nocardiopsis sp. EMB25]